MPNHIIFSNSPTGRRDFIINFFYEQSANTRTAQLACPFFSDAEPLKILRNAGCGRIQLLVRLCTFTSPSALREARELGDIAIRFFTAQSFHAKFYILGNVALIGSANMTGAGLKSNRELSIMITGEEEIFDDIPAIFDELWQRASVLTDDAIVRFASWHRQNSGSEESSSIDGIENASPETVSVRTRTVSSERTYLESYRHTYYEVLIPNYGIVKTVYEAVGRHPEFVGYPIEYEIDRFLSWTKLTFTTDEKLETNPIRNGDDLRQNINLHVQKWMQSQQKIDDNRVDRIATLQKALRSEVEFSNIGFEQLTDALLGCAAFDEQLRFTKGGQDALTKAFQADNTLDAVRRNFHHLAFGNEEFVRRTYDCIYSPALRIRHFGRSCVMELFGWINQQGVPPLNMRAVKALRYLGFDIKA